MRTQLWDRMAQHLKDVHFPLARTWRKYVSWGTAPRGARAASGVGKLMEGMQLELNELQSQLLLRTNTVTAYLPPLAWAARAPGAPVTFQVHNTSCAPSCPRTIHDFKRNIQNTWNNSFPTVDIKQPGWWVFPQNGKTHTYTRSNPYDCFSLRSGANTPT